MRRVSSERIFAVSCALRPFYVFCLSNLVAKMMKECVDFNIRFVQSVAKHKCLYDNTHCDYTNKGKTESAWKEISREIGEPDHLCKERWRNIRCSFLRYVREKSLGGPRFKKPYYLANHLQFVQPFLSFSMKNTGAQETDLYEPNETFESNYLPDAGDSTHIEATSMGIKEQKSQIENSLRPERKKAKFKKRKRCLTRLDDQLEDIALKYYQTKTVQMEEDDGATKADSMFLQSLLPDFQCMSPCGKRRVKIAIMKIIDDELKAQGGAS